MDTIGTSIYRKHLPKENIRLIYKLFLEKNGIRSIERITGHHRDTIRKLLMGTERNEKAELYLINEIGLTADECKKLWKLLEKKKNVCQKTSETSGSKMQFLCSTGKSVKSDNLEETF
ncbi:MAG: hypothetical protein ACPK85_04050 [Methanosarcina sp.]